MTDQTRSFHEVPVEPQLRQFRFDPSQPRADDGTWTAGGAARRVTRAVGKAVDRAADAIVDWDERRADRKFDKSEAEYEEGLYENNRAPDIWEAERIGRTGSRDEPGRHWPDDVKAEWERGRAERGKPKLYDIERRLVGRDLNRSFQAPTETV